MLILVVLVLSVPSDITPSLSRSTPVLVAASILFLGWLLPIEVPPEILCLFAVSFGTSLLFVFYKSRDSLFGHLLVVSFLPLLWVNFILFRVHDESKSANFIFPRACHFTSLASHSLLGRHTDGSQFSVACSGSTGFIFRWFSVCQSPFRMAHRSPYTLLGLAVAVACHPL